MQIIGAFIAEYAEIVDQKLNVTGGVLDSLAVPRAGQLDESGEPIFGVAYLVTLMQAGPDDHERPYRMTLEIVNSDGVSEVVADGPISVDAHQGENRFWVTPFGVQAEAEGRMVLVNTIEGGGTISVPVHLELNDLP